MAHLTLFLDVIRRDPLWYLAHEVLSACRMAHAEYAAPSSRPRDCPLHRALHPDCLVRGVSPTLPVPPGRKDRLALTRLRLQQRGGHRLRRDSHRLRHAIPAVAPVPRARSSGSRSVVLPRRRPIFGSDQVDCFHADDRRPCPCDRRHVGKRPDLERLAYRLRSVALSVAAAAHGTLRRAPLSRFPARVRPRPALHAASRASAPRAGRPHIGGGLRPLTPCP